MQFSSGLSACYPMDPFSRESSTQIKDHMTPIPSFCRDGDLESYHYLYDALLHRDVAHHEDNSTLSYHRSKAVSNKSQIFFSFLTLMTSQYTMHHTVMASQYTMHHVYMASIQRNSCILGSSIQR